MVSLPVNRLVSVQLAHCRHPILSGWWRIVCVFTAWRTHHDVISLTSSPPPPTA